MSVTLLTSVEAVADSTEAAAAEDDNDGGVGCNEPAADSLVGTGGK
jgi:hypothetical protein